MVSDKVFKTADEFIEALYSDAELLRKIREHLRIRGFGFDFETQYTIPDEEEDSEGEGLTAEDIGEEPDAVEKNNTDKKEEGDDGCGSDA